VSDKNKTNSAKKKQAALKIRILREFQSLGLKGLGIHCGVQIQYADSLLGRRNQSGTYNKHLMKGI
jgi:hypothetical protein